MTAINGTDKTSLLVLGAMKKGTILKDITQQFNISYDQAKRLSRFSSILSSAADNLSIEAFERLKLIGLKSLILHPLIKANDWDGLHDILYSIHPDITRDDLKLHILALEEKRSRVTQFQEKVDKQLRELKKKDRTLQTSLKELQILQKEITKNTAFLNKYEKDVKEFLLEHLGLTKDGQLCLAKRLDRNWQKNLQKKGILVFKEPPSKWSLEYEDWMEQNKNSAYTFIVKDLDAIAEELPKRLKRGWDCSWNYEKEYERNEKNKFSSWPVPGVQPRYL